MTPPPAPPFSDPIAPAALARRQEIAIDVAPDPGAARGIADALGLLGLKGARLRGILRPAGARDWRLEARLTATATQPCVVTLAPVVTRIDAPVTRRFVADWVEPGPGEHQMTADEDEIEPIGRRIDPGAVLVEALSLALPDHPRAPDAAPPDAPEDAVGEARHRPFAGLARKLGDGERD
jgi:hypothetical protein